jgi:hypothetical protein
MVLPDPNHPQPQPYVVIGLKEVYDAVLTLTGTVQGLVAHDAERIKDLADHETRLRSLERGRWPLPTITALAAVGALVLAILAFMYRNT